MKRLLAIAALVAGCGTTTPATTVPGTVLAPTASVSAPTAGPSPTLSPTPTVATTPAPLPTEAARQEIEILESGFTYFKGDTPYAQYGVVLDNPNESGWIATRVTVTVAFYDVAGNVLTTREDSASDVVPGKFAVGGTAFDVKGVRSMDVDIDTDWEEIDFSVGHYTPSRVKFTQGQYETRVTGVLKCTFTEDQENVEIVGIFRDSLGKVLGGESTYVEKVRCVKGTPFAIETLGRLGRAKKASVYPG
ncbi:MAG: hypothetical protein H0V50_02805 [Thermoleophilaceae bacterium]|nr:hypothetical protein [Thermoleophilaceae bacterium]